MKVYGPYIYPSGSNAGRRYVIVQDGDTRRQILYARHVMEQHLGRQLRPSETVDHIDENKTNDALANLQILSQPDNARKSNVIRSIGAWPEFDCPECGKRFTKRRSKVNANRAQGKAGPFCGRVCAGRYSARNA